MSQAWNKYLEDLEKRILKMYSEKVIFTEYFYDVGEGTAEGPEVHHCGNARAYQMANDVWRVWRHGPAVPPLADDMPTLDAAINWIVDQSED